MPVTAADPKPTPSIGSLDIDDIPDMSDDECLARLAVVVGEPDLEHLDEVARLVARLAVTIE